jgi:polar amino acid transport system substrate-binding protein
MTTASTPALERHSRVRAVRPDRHWFGFVLGVALFGLAIGCGDAPVALRSNDAHHDHAAADAGDVMARVTRTGVVRVGVKADTPPFSSERGGGYQGLDIDIAYAVANRLGIDKVQFVPVTSANRMDAIEQGTVDMVIAAMTITRYRERRVDFTIPYYQDGQALLVPVHSTVISYLDLAGKTVGTVKGSSSAYYLHQVAPDCKETVVADFSALRQLLDSGTVDAVTSDQTILIGMMHNAADPKRYRLAGAAFTSEPYGIAVPQNQSHWRNALNHALMEMVESGQWQSIIDSWFAPGTAYAHHVDFHPPLYPH